MSETRDRATTPLGPYRVLDLSGEWGFLCGKILGDLGADVIKIEPPGGDPERLRGPFLEGEDGRGEREGDGDPERSLYWFAYNTNKRGITLNLTTPAGQDLLRRLVGAVDFLVESFPPGYMDGLGLGYADLKSLNPRLVYTAVTPFGQTGPQSGRLASDIEVMAAAGTMSLAGDPSGPPLRISLAQGPLWAGLYAAEGSLVAHYHRQLTGQGQFVDVSAQASVLWANSHAPMFWDLNREIPRREGVYLTGRSITGAKYRTIWPCRDGYVTFSIYGGPAGIRTNQALVQWMVDKGMAPDWLVAKDWSKFDVATASAAEIASVEDAAAPFFASLTRQEFFEGFIARGMLGYPVATPSDTLHDRQLEARGFWRELGSPTWDRTLRYPGPFVQLSAAPPGEWRRAPLIGEHNRTVYHDELGLAESELDRMRREGTI